MADFYGNVTDADAYHLARGNSAWSSASNADKNRALLIASVWLDDNYSTQFAGVKTGRRSQLREWPRESAYDRFGYDIAKTEIPVHVERATYEIALREIVSPGSLYVDFTKGEAIKQVSVDGAVSVTYVSGSTTYQDAQLSIGQIDFILKDLLVDDDGGNMLSGSSTR